MKKNIGLITWYGSKNYGTNVQVYALYKKIKELGYPCDLIAAFNSNNFSWKAHLRYVLSFFNFEETIKSVKAINDLKQKKILNFIQEDISIKHVYTRKQYKALLKDYPIFITGSDQIWNPFHLSEFYLLNFASSNKRIAYASSIGVKELPKNKIELYKKHISLFDHIGLREKTGCDLIGKLLNRQDIANVLDPTFLLTPQDWITFAQNAVIEFVTPQKYILCYLIGNRDNYEPQIIDIQKRTGIQNLIIIQSAENRNFNIEGSIVYTNAGPKEFVWLIQHAELVCTDSFHATAISINLSIDFIEFLRFNNDDNKSQNSRIYDLLEHYQLQERIYTPHKDITQKIQYDPIKCILEKDRIDSIAYLINAIES